MLSCLRQEAHEFETSLGYIVNLELFEAMCLLRHCHIKGGVEGRGGGWWRARRRVRVKEREMERERDRE